MRVVILHNAVSADSRADERDVLDQVGAVCGAVRELGHEPTALPCTLDLETAKTQLLTSRPDVAFNLVESLGGSDRMMFLAGALLDSIGLPYTGSPTDALFLTTKKPLAKWLLRRRGLPTPDWMESTMPKQDSTLSGQFKPGASYIIKPVFEHASLGLDDDAVVACETADELRALIQQRQSKCRCPMFGERFIDGREFNVSLLAGARGPQVLPPAEIDFSAFPAGKPRIVGYRAKWEQGSFEFEHTPRTFDIASDHGLKERLAELSQACWRCFGLSGWARVDFRLDERGEPYILEINANSCLSPDAGFAAALAQAGIPFATAIERILADVTN